MYSVDADGAQLLLVYSDVFGGKKIPNLKKKIKALNMHKAISIICELIRVRDAYINPIITCVGEVRIPFETVLKKEMCNIIPKSSNDMSSNNLLRKDVHIISVQMLLLLLKNVIKYGNYETMGNTDYEVSKNDYREIIKLQLVVAEEINKNYAEKIDTDHFLYSNYHLNYKRNVAHEFSRMYYMLEKVSRDKNNFEDDVQREYRDYYMSFIEKYQFTPKQYSFLLFRELITYYSEINDLIYNTMWQNIEEIYEKSNIKELASKVIGTLSQSIDMYKDWAEESEKAEWDFSKFFEFPFIVDQKGDYISISDITLRNSFFEKIFWLIRNCYPEEDSRAMAFFGRIFEKYIQDLTDSAAKKEYVYVHEFKFVGNGQDCKSSDAYIRKGINLLVVEAKGFSVLIDCIIKNEKIERNNRKLFIDPVLQADSCLDMVTENKAEFKGVEDAYIISVTMDNINAVPHYYNEIHPAIITNKKSDKTKYFFNFNIEEYEMLMYLVEQNIDIFSLLKAYYEDTSLKPFGNYLHEKHPKIGMTSFMEKYYKEASEDMQKMFFESDL